MSGFVTVARLAEVPENGLVPMEVEGVKIVLANSGGQIHALHDECSHEEFPLSDGEIEGNQVTCLLHGARFDLETGAAKALPAVKPVRVYECRVEGDEIQVKLD
ncbi:MAG: non-heme iron oxygenase ferredoxin subunit [marine benthic group bacterium]|jgi:3-phenylpropionate/trans-cinnamate dioxygenase ferredoxin subunit|nr:non-heme iron oxygenase ferredoxin subunit [Gemmatimonadota bacterium]MCL7961812.1 non-heme iron oxygenase ferredoxin subunit [Candidatus Carthagonibacter metallireducens]MCL7937641.1 non-heme iron oxygenase ferredoxin subunit [Gemmatimonadota bacterium]MCL7957644.1 non-heme iron oxygenase ferredoxin subunit [Gemmatimonadota bacterium]MCL7964828.1 non-heme iron oxygenase ferredoxin subunit [Gemmatimonadota bacterium]